MIADFWSFLLSVVFISLSGVMTPGPLFAVTITKGLKDKMAGILVSVGHGVIEFPLMLLIFFGFIQFLSSSVVQKAIGLVGGILMVYMGVRMLQKRQKPDEREKDSRHGSIAAGILMTAANPYFILWWATVGASLILNAVVFGVFGFFAFALAHWLCDLLWNSFVTLTVFKSKYFWTTKVHNAVFAFCFLVLVGFGLWFMVSALL